MATEIVVAAISGGTGLAAGVVGSLFAPWANWGVEKRRLTRERRVERVAEWRRGVRNFAFAQRITMEGGSRWTSPEEVNSDLLSQDWYVTMRPEMAGEVITQGERLNAGPWGADRTSIPSLLEHEIARIERDKWKLV